MTVPAVANSASAPPDECAPSRTDTVSPRASSICEASVRRQIRS